MDTVAISTIRSQTVYTISCIECRRRKIKCDKLSPACSHCLSRKIDCEFPANSKRKIINLENGEADGTKKDEVIKQLLQRCATLEDYLKLGKLGQFQISKKIISKDFIEMVKNIDTRLHRIAEDSTSLDPMLWAKRNFPQILNGKEEDEVLLNNIITEVSQNFKAFKFFLTESDVTLFYENFKEETLEPVHFRDSLIMLLLLSICVRLKKFTCVHIPVDKKDQMVEELYQEFKARSEIETFEKTAKCMQIRLLEVEFMVGMNKHREGIIFGIHETAGLYKFIKWRDGNTNIELEACWVELQRIDAIMAISLGIKPAAPEPVNEDIELFKSEERRYNMAPIFIKNTKIFKTFLNDGVEKINPDDIQEQIDIMMSVGDLFFLLDVTTLYHIQLQYLYSKRDFKGYTKALENCMALTWKVSLNEESHIRRVRWILQLIFKSLLDFLLDYKEVDGELTISLSIIICLNNLFSLDNHLESDISHKIERYCPKLSFEYCFGLLSKYEEDHPHKFARCVAKDL